MRRALAVEMCAPRLWLCICVFDLVSCVAVVLRCDGWDVSVVCVLARALIQRCVRCVLAALNSVGMVCVVIVCVAVCVSVLFVRL